MSNSDIQQGLAQIVELLQRRNQAESEYIDSLSTIQERLNQALRQNVELNDNLEEQRNIRDQINESEERTIENTQSANRALSQQQSLFAKIKDNATAMGALSGAIGGLATGLSTTFRIGKIAFQSFIDLVGKATSTIFNLGKSIFMLPFNIFKSFVSMASSGSGSTELLDAIENVRKEWGSFKNETAGSVLQISSLGVSLKNLAVANSQFWGQSLAPGRSLARVWQSLAAMIKDVGELLTAMGPAINLVMNQFKESTEITRNIVAMQKGLGLTKEEFGALAKVSAISGKKIVDIEYEMGNLSLQLGDKFGLSAKKISSDVGKMMKDFDHFGNLSTKQLNSVAAYTQRLGIESTKLLGIMDKFDQFEDAAESASKLSQAFGLQVDSMEMMRAQDPAERFDMIRAAMVRAGISTDGMRNQTVKLFTSLTGLDAETARIGLSTKNLGKTYDEVKNETEKASIKQLDQTEVLTRLADAIEKVNRSGGGMKNGFLKTFLDGIQKGVERTPSFMNMMQNLRQGLRKTWFAGQGAGQSIFSMMGITDDFDAKGNMIKKGVFGTLGESFGPKAMGEFWGASHEEWVKGKKRIVEEGVKLQSGELFSVSRFLKNIFDPKATGKDIDKAFDNLEELLKNKFDKLTDPNNNSLYSKLTRLGDVLGRIFQRIFTSVGSKIGDMFKKGAVFLKGEDISKDAENAIDKAKESPWGKFITPVWEGIKSAFASAFDGFAEFAPELLRKIISGLTWVFKGVQYFLSDEKTKKELDEKARLEGKKSFLGMAPSKPGTKQDKFSESISNSFDKLTNGLDSVFKEDSLIKPFKEALHGAWESIKDLLISIFKDVLSSAWEHLAPTIAKFILAQMAVKAGTGAIQGFFGQAIPKLMAPAATTAAEVAGVGAAGAGVAGAGAGIAGLSTMARLRSLGMGTRFAQFAGPGGAQAANVGFATKALGGLGAGLEIGRGIWTGIEEAEETNRNVFSAGALGALTGSAKTGSSMSAMVGIQSGSGADKAMGVLGAALRGASVGGGVGLAAGGIGAIPGAIGGAIIGALTEGVKIMSEDTPEQVAAAAAKKQAQLTQEKSQTATPQTPAKPSVDIKSIETSVEKVTIDVQKMTVDLKAFENRLMQGVASIKESRNNVNVNVAVAVELNVKELEHAIVSNKRSLIRKAVSIIEQNISPNGSPDLREKAGPDGGQIPGKVFG